MPLDIEMYKAAIVCCSNGQKTAQKPRIELLAETLQELGIQPKFSLFLYEKEGCASGTAQERAEALMDFYRDDAVKAIFDISGGNLANEILPYLDFDVIAKSDKQFWGYSDLTTIINAIYAKTGKESVLYQVKNLLYDHAERQQEDFIQTVFAQKDNLFDFSYEMCQGTDLQGIVVGGNIRCFLKLAGTPYFPDVRGKVLLLEAYSGTPAQLTAYFSQLQQMGVFEQAAGVLLGTFTQMEKENYRPDVLALLKRFVRDDFPIARTAQIGHGTDSKGILIGGKIRLHECG